MPGLYATTNENDLSSHRKNIVAIRSKFALNGYFIMSTPRGTSSRECVSFCFATVRAENVIGEDKRLVHGTRHFRPGTKVFLHPPNWDGRVAAVGIPRYTDKYVRIVMSVRKLEHFSLEKVSDPELVAALLCPYETSPFVRMAPNYVGGTWDQSDECKQRIEDEIAYLTRSTS